MSLKQLRPDGPIFHFYFMNPELITFSLFSCSTPKKRHNNTMLSAGVKTHIAELF